MKKFKKSISILREKNVYLDKGLSPIEFKAIEAIYEIEFPNELKEFLSYALPVSCGFYNWRDLSNENIEFIKKQIDIPVNNVIELSEEIEWNENWGIKPSSIKKTVEAIRIKALSAPRLIPFYGHRYIPEIDCIKCPVISVHGIDVVCYGYGIEEYLSIEYGIKCQKDIRFDEVPNIDFWSDIM